MDKMSSGVYIIDSQFNIYEYNETAKHLYPTLEKGKKCYKCLMNLDSPCEVCPVVNETKGPTTYLDPIRNVYETVDCVSIPLPNSEKGHALVFSTVDSEHNLSTSFPTSEAGLRLMGLINVLSSDISDLYSLNMDNHQITIYRIAGNANGIYDKLEDSAPYEVVIDAYISNNVYADDQEEMRRVTDFEYIKKKLSKKSHFTFHYRTSRNNEIHYYNMKCSKNLLDNGRYNVIFAFTCEDNQENSRKVQAALETDPLTRLYTKEAFIKHCRELLDEHPNESFDIAIADIENFRLLNNIYGTDAGNELLIALSNFLQEISAPDILWGRFSGDQFIAFGLSKNSPSKDWLKEVVNKFSKVSPIPNVVIKWGTYQNVDKTLTVTYMCDRALVALKSIKHNYNRQIAMYDGEVSTRHYKSQLYEASFQHALSKKEFAVWYQPKYNADKKIIVGGEALVRWIKDEKVIPPGEFLNVFEKDGLIRELDEYVFKAVCEFQKKRLDLGKRIIPISINLSRASMYQSDVAKTYSEIAAEYGIDTRYLPIEITESTKVSSKAIKSLVSSFKACGFSLHMDDFGSEHSSLNSLNDLDFDVIKIDKGLIDYIGDKTGETILQHTITMANELNKQLIAEGVEFENQLDFLSKRGCEVIQGYYFSKPLPEKDFENLLAESEFA